MTHLYKLLEQRNYWYGKYLNCTSAFQTALKHAPEIALSELELFYGNRDSLLKILEGIDQKIDELLATPEWQAHPFTAEQTSRIQRFVAEKDVVVEKIVAIDKNVIGELERIQQESKSKLQSLLKGKKALAKYKSEPKHNEKIDKRV
ncbi:MAG: hypothetical protein ACXWQO_09875 [Bdellovibrionota bacterium]